VDYTVRGNVTVKYDKKREDMHYPLEKQSAYNVKYEQLYIHI
jgi:hypothetical protein